MKKKVLSQINMLAKSIIDSENDLDISKTKNTLIQLYEKLSVLEFLDSSVKTEFEKPERPATDSKTYREENWFKEPEVVPQPQHEEALVEPLMDKIKDIMSQMPNESQKLDEILKEILPKQPDDKQTAETFSNEIDEFASNYQEMPVFERKEQTNNTSSEIEMVVEKTSDSDIPKSLNDKLNQGVSIGLNDRLAFIKQLFDGSSEDYSRVLSQVNTMSSYAEITLFIEETVKPDYNNWEDKEEFATRFMMIIEKRFN